jgi:hypothetical protein
VLFTRHLHVYQYLLIRGTIFSRISVYIRVNVDVSRLYTASDIKLYNILFYESDKQFLELCFLVLYRAKTPVRMQRKKVRNSVETGVRSCTRAGTPYSPYYKWNALFCNLIFEEINFSAVVNIKSLIIFLCLLRFFPEIFCIISETLSLLTWFLKRQILVLLSILHH